MKVCSICKESKVIEEFYKNNYSVDGLQTYCITCSKIRSKERYKSFSNEKKDEIKKLASEKRTRNRQFLWDYLKIHPCVDCGETDPILLDMDHLRDKSTNVSSLSSQAVSIERIKEEIAKCEVRCVSCHRKKTAKEFGWYKDIVR